MYFFQPVRRKPDAREEAAARAACARQLGPDFDVETHFTPRYNPWDQRLCLVPDGDLFARHPRAARPSVVTDQIETFTETRHPAAVGQGARGRPDRHRDRARAAAPRRPELDGRRRAASSSSKTLDLQGHDVQRRAEPGVGFGYTNASWTLKCRPDLRVRLPVAQPHGSAAARASCTPRNGDPTLREEPWIDFSSGYIQRAIAAPAQAGLAAPWKLYQNYALDLLSLRFGAVRDKAMVLSALIRRSAGGQAGECLQPWVT